MNGCAAGFEICCGRGCDDGLARYCVEPAVKFGLGCCVWVREVFIGTRCWGGISGIGSNLKLVNEFGTRLFTYFLLDFIRIHNAVPPVTIFHFLFVQMEKFCFYLGRASSQISGRGGLFNLK